MRHAPPAMRSFFTKGSANTASDEDTVWVIQSPAHQSDSVPQVSPRQVRQSVIWRSDTHRSGRPSLESKTTLATSFGRSMFGSMAEASWYSSSKSVDNWDSRSVNTSLSGRHFSRRLGVVTVVASCLRSVCRRLLLCVAILALPVLSTAHMVLLDLALYNDSGPRVFSWLWAFILPELALVLHMLRNAFSESEILVGSLQWISYSWLVALKYCIIIFSAVPQLSSSSADQLFEYVFFSPVIYCILCYKALQKLRTGGGGQDRAGGPPPLGQALADRREEETLDAMLFQDMIWHVVIDMIDIQIMMRLTTTGTLESSSSGAERGLDSEMAIIAERYPERAEMIKTVAGVFVFLGLFFHQQSFPSVAYSSSSAGADHWRKRQPASATPARTTQHSGSSSLGRLTSVILRPTMIMKQLGGRTSVAESELSVQTSSTAGGSDAARAAAEEKAHHRRHRGHAYKVDVVKARKRSAIVSILLVDVPFFAVRTSVYSIVLLSPRSEEALQSTTVVVIDGNATVPEDDNTTVLEDNTTTTTTTAASADVQQETWKVRSSRLPSPDIWWVKNLVFIVLQAMQLRFVQQADLERSRDLVLLTKSAVGAGGKRYRMKRTHDESLKKVWLSIDQERTESQGALQPREPEALGASPEPSPTAAAQADLPLSEFPGRRGSALARGTVGAFAPDADLRSHAAPRGTVGAFAADADAEGPGGRRASAAEAEAPGLRGRWRPTAPARGSLAPGGEGRMSRRESADSGASTERRAATTRRGKPKLRPMATIMSVGSTYTRSTTGLSFSRSSRPADLDDLDDQDEEQEVRCASARRLAGRICCCCQRRSQGGARCFCFTCDCSLWVLLHCFVGLFLGWFVAKVDFHQVLSESAVLSQAQGAR